MPVKTRVSATSETVVGDVEIQHQRHRARRVRKVGRQLNIPTMPTPAVSYVSHCHGMCRAEEVSNLVNHPVVYPLPETQGQSSPSGVQSPQQ